MSRSFEGKNDHLRRLDREFYQGDAFVHWILTIENRATGWLSPVLYYKFRELLAHATFRYAFTCPIFCLMPDHLHMLWMGLDDRSDQLNGMRYFRSQFSSVLDAIGYSLQHQPYDRVLRNDERLEAAVADLCEYIARNPERKGLVPHGEYRNYKYTNCLIPGYPELHLWQDDFWQRFWRTYAFSRTNGLFRAAGEVL